MYIPVYQIDARISCPACLLGSAD